MRIKVLHPVSNHGIQGKNNASVVMILTYHEVDILLTGDLEESMEYRLSDQFGKLLDIEILKVGHHGSKTSTSRYFLSQTTPQVALVSVGKKNRYGHPNIQVISRLRKKGIKVYRTDQEGAIEVKTDGKKIEVETFMGQTEI